MNALVPLVSLIGPIYFAVQDFSLEFVVAWAALWTGLRFLAVWKQAFTALQESDGGKSPWRYPSVAFVGVFIVTLAIFETTHVVVYWTICRLIRT